MMINNNSCLCSPVQKWATQWPLAGRPRSQCHLIYYPALALSAHKQSHYVRQIIATLLRQTPRATPLGANSRASESKASSSLECSAECSRESTKLTFYVRKTIATLLRQILPSNPLWARACLRVQARPARL